MNLQFKKAVQDPICLILTIVIYRLLRILQNPFIANLGLPKVFYGIEPWQATRIGNHAQTGEKVSSDIIVMTKLVYVCISLVYGGSNVLIEFNIFFPSWCINNSHAWSMVLTTVIFHTQVRL